MWRTKLRRGRTDCGFTLIELMIVVLIISILIAIAIPTFNGARRLTQDKQAQANLRNGLVAQKTYYVDSQTYADDGVPAQFTALREIESALSWNTPDAWTRGVDVFALATFISADDGVGMESVSKSGRRFCMADVARSAPDGSTWFANVSTAASCPAVAAGMVGWTKDASVGWRY